MPPDAPGARHTVPAPNNLSAKVEVYPNHGFIGVAAMTARQSCAGRKA